jgi:hypothetical protein
MKLKISFLLLFTLSLNSFSQYVNAELHFFDGSIKKGLAEINIINDKIKFKENKKGKRTSYNHKKIEKLILKNNGFTKIFRYKKTLGRRAPRLLELVIENKNLSLYATIVKQELYGLLGVLLKIPTKVTHTYYMVKQQNNKAIYFGDTDLTSRKRLREIVKKHLKDCLALIEKSENKEYKTKDIPQIVGFYNTNCSQ